MREEVPTSRLLWALVSTGTKGPGALDVSVNRAKGRMLWTLVLPGTKGRMLWMLVLRGTKGRMLWMLMLTGTGTQSAYRFGDSRFWHVECCG